MRVLAQHGQGLGGVVRLAENADEPFQSRPPFGEPGTVSHDSGDKEGLCAKTRGRKVLHKVGFLEITNLQQRLDLADVIPGHLGCRLATQRALLRHHTMEKKMLGELQSQKRHQTTMGIVEIVQNIAKRFLDNIYAAPIKFLIPGTSNFQEAIYPLVFMLTYGLVYSAYIALFVGEELPLGEEGVLGEEDLLREEATGPLGEESEGGLLKEVLDLGDPLGHLLGFVGGLLGKAPAKAAAQAASRQAQNTSRAIRRTPWWRSFTRGVWQGYLIYFFVATVTLGVTGSIYQFDTPKPSQGYSSYRQPNTTGYSSFRPPTTTGYNPSYGSGYRSSYSGYCGYKKA